MSSRRFPLYGQAARCAIASPRTGWKAVGMPALFLSAASEMLAAESVADPQGWTASALVMGLGVIGAAVCVVLHWWRRARENEEQLKEEVRRRERAERALWTKEDALGQVLRLASLATWELDLAVGTLRWSGAAAELIGGEEADFPATSEALAERVHRDDRRRRETAHERMSDGGGAVMVEYRLCRPDGTERSVREWAERMETGTGGPGGVRAVLMDITDVHDFTRCASDGEPLLRVAGQLGRLGGWTLELPERRLVWSEQVRALHGWTEPDGPSEEQAIAAFAPEWREMARRAIALCASDGQPFDFEAQLLAGDGARLWVRAIGEAERDAEGVVRRIKGAMQDIQERKAMEQQFLRAQRQESIGLLAGGIAHDLNNVLTPILMSIDLMRLRMRDPEDLHILNTINQSARRGAEMVRQILSFARGTPGTRVSTPVLRLFREIEVLLQDTLPRSVSWEIQLADDVRPVWCDPTQIHQVLLNLCVNARDAMPQGGLLTLSARNADPNDGDPRTLGAGTAGRHVVLEVTDTGTGIPPELREKIFDPFFTTKDVGKGTGLGLSTAAGIVRAHGGILQVASEPGHGATFRIYLPAAESGPAVDGPEAGASAPHGRGETILIVDDEDGVRAIMRQALEGFGYRVMEAENGADGVALYVQRRAEIDLVLTDIMMPIMDGLTTIRALLNLNRSLPIIGASGLNAGVNRDDAVAAGATDFLAKPFTAETLLTTVRRVLDASVRG